MKPTSKHWVNSSNEKINTKQPYLEELKGSLGLSNRFDAVGNNQRDFGDTLNAVTTSHHKGREGRASEGRSGSVAALVVVYLLVPLAPNLYAWVNTHKESH